MASVDTRRWRVLSVPSSNHGFAPALGCGGVLQTECGSAFTSKLEGMFKDIDLSRDLMGTYSQHLKTKLEDPSVFRHQRSRDMDLHVQASTLACGVC